MEYTSLKKVYYENNPMYESIYRTRFNDPDAIHLNLSIHGYPAFFLQTAEILKLIIQIQKVDKKVINLQNRLPGVALEHFTRRCLIDEIVLTNNIEGVNSTRKDIGEVLDDLKSQDKNRRFYGLVNKYFLLQSSKSLPLNTCQDIRDIYEGLVLKEVVEEDRHDAPDGKLFRKEAVSVYSPAQKEIHTGLYPEAAIISAMEEALQFLENESVDLLIRTSAFHYLLGYIHPFYNGNGRLSRFISSYLLGKELTPLISYRLSYTIKENINGYYDAFKICNDAKNRGDITPFISHFLNIIYTAIGQLYEALSKRQQALTAADQKLETAVFDHQQNEFYDLGYFLLQASLFSEAGISTGELLDVCHISRSTLKKRLTFYESRGLLITKNKGSQKLYSLDLDLLEKL